MILAKLLDHVPARDLDHDTISALTGSDIRVHQAGNYTVVTIYHRVRQIQVVGVSKRNPREPENPAIGIQVAAVRAYRAYRREMEERRKFFGAWDRNAGATRVGEAGIFSPDTLTPLKPGEVRVGGAPSGLTEAQQIAAVQDWQDNPEVHPLTCGVKSSHGLLVAAETGGGKVVLVCPDCDYKQEFIPPVVLDAYRNRVGLRRAGDAERHPWCVIE